MFSLPDEGSHPTKFADWLELSALCSPNGRIGISELVSGTDLEENEESEELSEDDVRQDNLVISTQSEIADRRKIIGGDYPFEMDESGRHFTFTGGVTSIGAVYLFSLFLSHSQDHTIIPEDWAPKLDNRARNLFQACSTVAAGGYVVGIAISFGWPRPEGTSFLDALKKTYKAFGDGVPHDKPRPSAPKWIKDGGIDIIAWQKSIDNLAGTEYLIGQVASGDDWKDKSVRTDADVLHRYWFRYAPASDHKCAIFIPFCLEPEQGADEDVTPQDALVPLKPEKTAAEHCPLPGRLEDYMQQLTVRFGLVFYRYRLTAYVARAVLLAKGGHEGIGGMDQLPQIMEWVNDYRLELCQKVTTN